MDYTDFLSRKLRAAQPVGFAVEGDLHPALFGFQRDITHWALRRGRGAVFADCGMGKTIIELCWAREVARHTGRPVLVFAPLAVAAQIQREGDRFGFTVTRCRTQADVQPGINVANYEMLEHFDPAMFGGVVLDEASILKAFSGVARRALTDFGSQIPYRLTATATPAPNDLIEITNQAEFLGVLSGKEIIALFFTQDGNTTHAWRLKGHAKTDFWRWMASWAVAVRRPSDLGYDDGAFILPPLAIEQLTVPAPPPTTTLFPVEALTLQERQTARRESVDARVTAVAELVNADREPWLVWCNLNAESEAITRAIPGAVEIRGSDSIEHKERAVLDFIEGRVRVIVSKPSITGHGMNFQHCARMAFVGLSDSWEQYYQAIRRAWRFGQTRPVRCYVVTAETEGAVVANINRKEAQAMAMMDALVEQMRVWNLDRETAARTSYREDAAMGEGWTLYLGDCIQQMRHIESESVGLSVFSPPFPGMYAYTDLAEDIGNTGKIEDFLAHFRYLVGREHLLRVTMPGRMACVHLMQLTAMKSREGWIGLHDYRGKVIAMMQEEGWVYAGEVTIDKNPQIQATRNKERGLLFKTLATDSSLMRMALADYLLYFRKPGDNPVPIRAGMSPKYNPGKGWITEREWIEWAAPVWYRQTKDYPGGIRETDVLNVAQARETDDERHLCPLQLGVIERAVKLWSAPGDLVLSPFAGIGSEGYVALKLGRRFAGIELKESYWQNAIANLTRAVHESRQIDLFSFAATAEAQPVG